MFLIITLRSFQKDVMWVAFHLPVQSVPITTNVMSSNEPTRARCTRYNIMW